MGRNGRGLPCAIVMETGSQKQHWRVLRAKRVAGPQRLERSEAAWMAKIWKSVEPATGGRSGSPSCARRRPRSRQGALWNVPALLSRLPPPAAAQRLLTRLGLRLLPLQQVALTVGGSPRAPPSGGSRLPRGSVRAAEVNRCRAGSPACRPARLRSGTTSASPCGQAGCDLAPRVGRTSVRVTRLCGCRCQPAGSRGRVFLVHECSITVGFRPGRRFQKWSHGVHSSPRLLYWLLEGGDSEDREGTAFVMLLQWIVDVVNKEKKHLHLC
nr:uncharacterized protein LOC106025187 isoform X1 [Cavia porcellus]